MPEPVTSNAKAEGRFDKSDFIYVAKDDVVPVPCGRANHLQFSTVERNRLEARLYWTSTCPLSLAKVSARLATTVAWSDPLGMDRSVLTN